MNSPMPGSPPGEPSCSVVPDGRDHRQPSPPQGQQSRTARAGGLTTCWPPSTRRAHPPRVQRHGPQPDLADRHHRAPHWGGQAVPVRGQGPLLEQDRGLLHRLADEVLAGGVGVGNAIMLRDPQGTIVHSDRGSQFRSKRVVRPVKNIFSGSVQPGTTRRWRVSSPCCRRTDTRHLGQPP